MPKQKIIAIVGPTGSGKTTLSINIAKQFNGEIINADSRAIYIGMDIVTAKPTLKEQDGVVHHLFDIANPDDVVTVSRYVNLAKEKIKEIASRGKLPIIVGGTGLYIDALLQGFQFPPVGDAKLREEFDNKPLTELLIELDRIDPTALNEIDRHNKRRVIRALEVCQITGNKFSNLKTKKQTNYDVLWLAIEYSKEQLLLRLEGRADEMLSQGVLDETRKLFEKYDQDLPAMSANGYPIWQDYLKNKISLDKAKHLFVTSDWQLARRQLTWFRRNKAINWLVNNNSITQATVLVKKFLK